MPWLSSLNTGVKKGGRASLRVAFRPTFPLTPAYRPNRFYGKSQPFDDLSVDNLKYLSSQQALADAAEFMYAFQSNRSLPEHTAVIVYGGSYSGALAAFFRTKYVRLPLCPATFSSPFSCKLISTRSVPPCPSSIVRYPHVALAAVANSAPVLAKLDFFEYHEVVNSALASVSPACPERMANATATITSMIATMDGRQKLIADLNVMIQLPRACDEDAASA